MADPKKLIPSVDGASPLGMTAGQADSRLGAAAPPVAPPAIQAAIAAANVDPSKQPAGLQSNYVGSGPTDPDSNLRFVPRTMAEYTAAEQAKLAGMQAPSMASTTPTTADYTAQAEAHLKSLYPKGTFDAQPAPVPAAAVPAAPVQAPLAQVAQPAPVPATPKPVAANVQALVSANNAARTPTVDPYAGPAAAPMGMVAPGTEGSIGVAGFQQQLNNIRALDSGVTGGVAILPDYAAEQNKASAVNDILAKMAKAKTPSERRALGQLANTMAAGVNQMEVEGVRQAGQNERQAGQNAVQKRGQDVQRAVAGAQDATARRGQDVQQGLGMLRAETDRYATDTGAAGKQAEIASRAQIQQAADAAALQRAQLTTEAQKFISTESKEAALNKPVAMQPGMTLYSPVAGAGMILGEEKGPDGKKQVVLKRVPTAK